MSERNDDARNERLYNAVENALAHMRRRVSPEAQMEVVRQRFPAPVFFIESNRYMLMRAGLPKLDAFYFTMIPGLTRRAMRDNFGKKPLLNTVSRMAEFLKTLYVGVHIECFYLILLDSAGKLVDAVLAQRGTDDSAPFYMKQVLSIAVRKESKAIVLCHNHPCGTLRPSKEDVACTLRMLNAVAALGIPMLDHIIIAGDKAVSLRELGSIPAQLWLMQNPKMKLLRDWLDRDLL